MRIEDIFNWGDKKIKQEVIEFIQSEGVTVVLCDGGDKVGELEIISKYDISLIIVK